MCTLASESRFERAVRKAALCMYWKLSPDRKTKVATSELLENISHYNPETGKKAYMAMEFWMWQILSSTNNFALRVIISFLLL